MDTRVAILGTQATILGTRAAIFSIEMKKISIYPDWYEFYYIHFIWKTIQQISWSGLDLQPSTTTARHFEVFLSIFLLFCALCTHRFFSFILPSYQDNLTEAFPVRWRQPCRWRETAQLKKHVCVFSYNMFCTFTLSHPSALTFLVELLGVVDFTDVVLMRHDGVSGLCYNSKTCYL